MDMTLFLALLGFAFVASGTPGPNNLMLLASGANFGFKRTLPHMLGISLGHSFMVFVIGLGLAQAFHSLPMLRNVLTVVSIVYMLWLAWKIAHAAAPKGGDVTAKPFTFLQAAAFQWVNPKAVIMAISAQTNYAQGDTWLAALFVGLGFLMVNFPAITLWAWMGTELRRFLTNARRLALFNWTMAALLVASLVPILLH
ncbi:threonine/homoserine/homoserine lactone efflux protein [Pacificibacter maritimus]|uniref:Threonine/homoserine/homoserine lactone efflux protein n=1 Tax=Pacificibacter maritimus TaxID=762213 RepID=A0A3N4ULZ1_9RHOB|nr:LysE family translocator [Pacificibacter maritimus]RPE71018.1 threonine/homoserine/homoserine lactone efflux protein [Pacificibacter maritimus]